MSKSNSDELDQQKNDHFQTLQDAESVLGQAPDRNLIIPELYEKIVIAATKIALHLAKTLPEFLTQQMRKC